MGWEALEAWGDAERIEKQTGGFSNDVWSVRIGDRQCIARLGTRSEADLEWEASLMRHLLDNDITVPSFVPTVDGRWSVDGLMVMERLDGVAPDGEEDWRRVAEVLRKVHDVTRGWPQRPGWRASIDLLTESTGTRINLGAMPFEGVERCRAAWERLPTRETCVVHGDVNRTNILVTPERIALIDWDESHVDVADQDLALPHNAAGLDADAYDVAEQARCAWEAAVCWPDDHAQAHLAKVRPR